ncbi:aminopeptidase N [Actimicrobium sp. GrIS 1.19]|uniref:M1 family metallopeptidase n=1 Tax=Actimicrobium sp. GrIS 1.19 TaxID=3071708 RepID=UPI002DF95932|nr:aminopeptidase N [Actimicrobium sp. GrIS 1.19]
MAYRVGIIDTRERAMSLDALDSTHAVVQHVATAAQASQAFDAITYSKGEAVIRMLENHVGAEAWRAGVRAYMKRHAYGNTVSDDLWRALEQTTGKPIMAIAHDFTLQPGVPMIRVADVSCKAGNSIITLTQAEFSRSQPDKKALGWRVPVTLQVGASGPPVQALVRNQKAVVRAPGCGAVLVNAGQTGYYRTLYEPTNFAALVANFGALAPVDQLGLLADTAQLGLAGLQPLSDFLALVDATPLSAEPKVWSEIAEVFAAMDRYYAGDTTRQGRFRHFALARLTPIMAQLGWIAKAGEPDAIAPIREQLVLAMSALDDQPTIAEARRRYASNDIGSAALRKMTLSVLAEHADSATWEKLRRAAQTETSTVVKVQLYDLLAASKDDTLARQALELALTDEPGLTTSAGMIRRVADYHPDLAFDFAIAHRASVDLLVDITSRSRYFPALAVNSADPAMRKKLVAYADAYLTQDARRELDISVAKITDRIRVQDAPLRSIDRWLERNPG